MQGDLVNFADLFSHIGQHTVDGLSKGAIYALIALGYTLVYGVLRLINFAHSEVFMVGTFAVLGLWTALGVENNPPLGQAVLFLVLGLIVAAIASGGTALAIERVAYRPLRRKNAPPLIFLITAIGLSLVLVEVFGLVLPKLLGDLVPSMFGRGRIILGMPTIIEQKTLFTIGNTEINNVQLIVIVSAVAMMAVLDWFINRTRYGRGVRAVAQNPETAALMGVNQERVIMLIFVLGGIMAGAAALLWGMRFGFTQNSIGFVLGLKAFTAAVLGGIGNLRGALLGGLFLGIVEVYGATIFASNWEDVIAFVVLVIVLMFRPTGILGESLGRARA
ncbi:branched-chain amino acid ABC transporter permease [Verrucosispora sp. SN26_14.1]|uniref:branched-chain amino acid ABC transporter permease n=1 Tax=Verrucosispora sp. SN26_14.1 TaxID=2527879 RepID=UPI00374498A2